MRNKDFWAHNCISLSHAPPLEKGGFKSTVVRGGRDQNRVQVGPLQRNPGLTSTKSAFCWIFFSILGQEEKTLWSEAVLKANRTSNLGAQRIDCSLHCSSFQHTVGPARWLPLFVADPDPLSLSRLHSWCRDPLPSPCFSSPSRCVP